MYCLKLKQITIIFFYFRYWLRCQRREIEMLAGEHAINNLFEISYFESLNVNKWDINWTNLYQFENIKLSFKKTIIWYFCIYLAITKVLCNVSTIRRAAVYWSRVWFYTNISFVQGIIAKQVARTSYFSRRTSAA